MYTCVFFFFKQKTAYEMRISDWSSDVCSSDLDRVVVHAGQWDLEDPWVTAGNDPGLAPTFRVWGYDTCWGSFAQFSKVQAHQCLPKAERLTWEEIGRASCRERVCQYV